MLISVWNTWFAVHPALSKCHLKGWEFSQILGQIKGKVLFAVLFVNGLDVCIVGGEDGIPGTAEIKGIVNIKPLLSL